MKIHIEYSDGRYTYRKVDWGERSVEVPDETVALWDAVFAAANLVEEQLAALDNARYEAAEAAGQCSHGTPHARDCYECRRGLP